ncbi:uncharacterized protein A4U43_C05F29090 [Asparagus officinalis]|uniref:Uncharacterized protein n=1 Tax=Asparagus officinalis TaxID=4686 RepID=A0A5P1EWV4_ASPOF|nr:uncharacterized protein A4U43_C05F29090 [Asparagus officinalis]
MGEPNYPSCSSSMESIIGSTQTEPTTEVPVEKRAEAIARYWIPDQKAPLHAFPLMHALAAIAKEPSQSLRFRNKRNDSHIQLSGQQQIFFPESADPIRTSSTFRCQTREQFG